MGIEMEKQVKRFLDKMRWPAAITLLFMALLTAADTSGRYIFLRPIKGAYELQELLMVVVVFLSAGYCTILDQHAKMEVGRVIFFKGKQAIVDGITTFLSALIFGLISWQSATWGWKELVSASGRRTQLLLIPEAPFILLAAIGSFFICLACLINFLHIIKTKTGKEE